MASKLNSMRLLEKHNIPYEALTYPDSIKDAEEVAEALGIPYHMVYKTLVIQADGEKKPILAMIASDRRLDLKKAARAANFKKVYMAAHKDAESLTGLKVGGISGLALTQKNWTVLLDAPATELEHIVLSAGQRGTQLRVGVMSLMQVLRARTADISTD